eukprot:jgi/Undpi1/9304/HiC_scaffold_26.g11762.m1
MLMRLRRSATTTCALLLLLRMSSIAAKTYTVSSGDKIQDALDQVSAGDTVEIEEGNYWEDLKTKAHGTESKPITIKAASGADQDDVVLRGDGNSRMFEIRHDYYIIKDFTVDGKALSDPDDDNYEEAYRNKLIYAFSEDEYTTRSGGYKSAIDGLEITNMVLKNAGDECVRLRYIGTSDSQWTDDEPDICSGNHIYNNYIKTKGNEGIQVKEGSIDTLIENNEIYMQRDDDSGGVDCRGDRCVIRYNHIEDTEGAGIRLGGSYADGIQYGVDSHVYGNTLVNCEYCGIKIQEEDQGVICENVIEPPNGVSNYRYTRGDGADAYPDPTEDCSSTPGPSSPSPNPSPSPSPTPPGTIGCYEDKEGDRIMSWGFSSGSMTNELCALYCKDDNKDYSGTQDGNECWCTDSDNYDEHGKSSDCDAECSGNDDEYCGGENSLTVSKTDDYEEPRCWCGSDDEYDRHGTSSGCTRKCDGDKDQICGGKNILSVYAVTD